MNPYWIKEYITAVESSKTRAVEILVIKSADNSVAASVESPVNIAEGLVTTAVESSGITPVENSVVASV